MKSLCLVLLVLLALPVANAGINLEPYLGYLSGTSKQTSSGIDVETSYKTPMVGARLGYGMMGFSFGLDYSMSLGNYEVEIDKPTTTGPYDEFKSSNLGLYAGYTLPIMLRFWGTYFLKSKSELETVNRAGSNVGDKREGKGYALGVGWTGLPFLALNLEYRMITVDETTNGSTGTVTSLPSASLSELDIKELMLSLSFPLNF